MQWHWGNIGSAEAGTAALIAALFAIYGVVRYGPAWLRDSGARQQAEQISLERRRGLHGWSGNGVDTFGVALVTSAAEMDQAREELTGGGPSGYVILRVAESKEKYGNANRGHRLREIIKSEGLISRPPTPGEREALETGLDAFDIPRAAFGRARL